MAKPNSEYWQERFNALNENLLNKGEEYNKAMVLAYDEAIQNIQREIEIFYERFAANNLISLSEAKKILNSEERKAFQMTLAEYIKYGKQNALDGKWVKELESASDIYRMDRLRSLQLQMRQQVEILEAKKATGIADTLGKIYKEGYYKTIYEIQKGLGEGVAFSTLDTNKIEKVLSKPWAPDGSTFSQKIWGTDRTNLLYQLDTKFTQALIRGDNPSRIVKDMANTLNVSKSAASRLVMTESAYVASASRQDGYKALEIEEFEYVATLDLKTSDLCQSMDGQHFPMSDYQVGVNAPPLHPWCRSTTVPYFNDEFTVGETRAARDEDGKTYKVPADMKYQQWKTKYVDNTRENVIIKAAKENHIRGEINTNPQKMDVSKYSFDDKHINSERNHYVTRAEAESFIESAKVSFNRWDGRFVCYIGSEGSTYVDTKNKNIRTAFRREQYDSETLKFVKEVEKFED